MQPVRGSQGEGRRWPPPLPAAAAAAAAAANLTPPPLSPTLPPAHRSYPLVAVVVVASSLGIYSSIRHLWTNPEVL